MDKELSAQEALDYWYELAKDEQNPPDMVHGMLAACANGWIKLVRDKKTGDVVLHTTTAGISEAEKLSLTPAGKELIANFKRIQLHKT